VILASALMAGLLFWGSGALQGWFLLEPLERAWRLLVWIGAGGGTYFSALFLMGIRLRHFRGGEG